MGSMRVLRLREWKTPASDFKEEKVGLGEIKRVTYNADGKFYRMEGIRGYDYFLAAKPLKLTMLKIQDEGWMIDDPLHWYGMQDLASISSGRVLAAGLGLGLVAYAYEDQNIDSLDVVEINKDVVSIVSQYLSRTKANIICADFWEYLRSTNTVYDTVILDMWTYGDPKSQKNVFNDMLNAVTTAQSKFPNAKLYVWGLRDPKYNPAIRKTPVYLESS